MVVLTWIIIPETLATSIKDFVNITFIIILQSIENLKFRAYFIVVKRKELPLK